MDNLEHSRTIAAQRTGRICVSNTPKMILITFQFLGKLSKSEIDDILFMYDYLNKRQPISYNEYVNYLSDVFSKIGQQIQEYEPKEWADNTYQCLKMRERQLLEQDNTIAVIQDTTGISADVILEVLLPYLAFSKIDDNF